MHDTDQERDRLRRSRLSTQGESILPLWLWAVLGIAAIVIAAVAF